MRSDQSRAGVGDPKQTRRPVQCRLAENTSDTLFAGTTAKKTRLLSRAGPVFERLLFEVCPDRVVDRLGFLIADFDEDTGAGIGRRVGFGQ